ncbi:TonB-dependent receptor [Aquiflexum sp.]|uniref:TonB-dependent receptor n=1 Tax=Aquiflexum sp. TaxID=1872584 RepID=UPI0035938916
MRRSIPTLVFLIFLGNVAFAQNSIEGVVKDEFGKPVIGASVLVEGTINFAVSDGNGKFLIQSSQNYPLSIKVSFVGFKSVTRHMNESVSSLLEFQLEDDLVLSEVLITSRRREEEVQAVPIPISVIGGALLEETQAFNVNRLKELVPTVQLYSSNPRNTTLNIRGLGSTFGLTNDGIDPGVGFYVDGVYFARPAVTSLDFIDIEQIEVLRGPQGTLFGKNTTAGAFNITTRRPRFQPDAKVESSFGNYGFIQTRGSVTGPLSKKSAGRLSFSGTSRDGLVFNEYNQKNINTLNNLGLRGQFLYLPSDNVELLLAADATRQRPDGYAQVIAGVVPTQRAPFRQFNQIISDLNYQLPSLNPFDRVVDQDTPWRSNNDLGGVSLNVDAKVGGGTLTSTSAWRYWNWEPSNDRDFTGLQVLSLSQAPFKHNQWSQEVRYASEFNSKLSGIIGVFGLYQDLRSTPYHTEESGIHQWRFIQNNQNPLWEIPGLLEGYGIRTTSSLKSFSGAVFGQLDWEVFDKFFVLPGLRWNYDQKSVVFDRRTYGGLQTDDPALIALKNQVYNDQDFSARVDESNFSGQLTLSYRPTEKINAFGTYSSGFKPVGVNLGGLPRESGRTMTELARIEPEQVNHYEFGVKSSPGRTATVNLVYHYSDIKNYQTLVQTPDLSVNRGYLANAERVGVQGWELDANLKASRVLSFFGALAYTDAKYVRFTNAPVPLEEVGNEPFKDISGGRLPGVSKWAGSFGGEWFQKTKFIGLEGKIFLSSELFFRSEFSSSPSPSQFLNIDGYSVVNARAGFRGDSGLSFFIWSRNMFDTQYFEQFLPGAGNAGHYAAVLGDPRTVGLTFTYNLKLN